MSIFSILNILVPLCCVIISLVFFYLCKVLFLGFLQFNSNFVNAQNNSKYRDWAALSAIGNVLFKICTSNKVDEVICLPQIKSCSFNFMRADTTDFFGPSSAARQRDWSICHFLSRPGIISLSSSFEKCFANIARMCNQICWLYASW